MSDLNDRIRELWPHYTVVKIAMMLGTTPGSVCHRVRRMGLPRKKRGFPPGQNRLSRDKELQPLEIMPGHFAADARSYDLIMKAKNQPYNHGDCR